jgi:hypothetical protein
MMKVNEKGKIESIYPFEVQWIRANKDILNLKSVAEKTHIPVKNLWNYCNDIHSLNKVWWPSVIKFVRKRNVKEQEK